MSGYVHSASSFFTVVLQGWPLLQFLKESLFLSENSSLVFSFSEPSPESRVEFRFKYSRSYLYFAPPNSSNYFPLSKSKDTSMFLDIVSKTIPFLGTKFVLVHFPLL